MFTGIVQGRGRVLRKQPAGGGMVFALEADFPLTDPAEGESIAVNGVCLTVTRLDNRTFAVDVMPQTLRQSNTDFIEAGKHRAAGIAGRKHQASGRLVEQQAHQDQGRRSEHHPGQDYAARKVLGQLGRVTDQKQDAEQDDHRARGPWPRRDAGDGLRAAGDAEHERCQQQEVAVPQQARWLPMLSGSPTWTRSPTTSSSSAF